VRRALTFIGGAIILGVFVAGFIAYFVTSFDAGSQTWLDGFGRPLSVSPWFMRFVFGQERLWAGWGWFFADMAIFWGGVALGFGLVNYGSKDTSGRRDMA
jgi:hypothetical protein